LSVAIVEKSAGKESGVRSEKSDDPDAVVVSVLDDESFEELPHAERPMTTAVMPAIATARLNFLWLVFDVRGVSTSVSRL